MTTIRSSTITRRGFLTQGIGAGAIVSASQIIPSFLMRAAAAEKTLSSDRVLVVLQLTGGNDGLGTVIPYADDLYHKNRFSLRQDVKAIHKLDDHVGLHPALGKLAPFFKDGKLTIAQGIGYSNASRSHFESMDYWHTGGQPLAGGRATGWLGRALDSSAAKEDPALAGIHLGSEQQPLALAGLKMHVPSLRAVDSLRVPDRNDPALAATMDKIVQAPRTSIDGAGLSAFALASASEALTASRRVSESIGNYRTQVDWPGTPLAVKLRGVAQLIDAGLATRIYYVTLDGFDTHSNQAAPHAALLGELGNAIAAFVEDIAAHGHANRVTLLTFSEFGRRVKENASGGTDHGAAAPIILAGGALAGGIVGAHPSLSDLDDGDLKFHTDFRQVYASLLDDWLGIPSEPVLGARFKRPKFFG